MYSISGEHIYSVFGEILSTNRQIKQGKGWAGGYKQV